MISQPPIPESLWNTVPAEAQVAILAVLDSLKGRIAEPEQRVGDLEARLKLNSTNSSKPPSSDPIGFKRKPPTPPSGRKRGGQPGHPRAQRRLVPAEKVRTFTECRPTDCRRCGHTLVGDDPTPLVHQVAELPKIEPLVDEYQLHRLDCPRCGMNSCARRDDGGKAQLWVVVTALIPVFTIAAKRSAAVAKSALGSKPSQVVTSDRHS